MSNKIGQRNLYFLCSNSYCHCFPLVVKEEAIASQRPVFMACITYIVVFNLSGESFLKGQDSFHDVILLD